MQTGRLGTILSVPFLCLTAWLVVPVALAAPPAEPVRLIFIHHSTGENWLADDDGGLGIALRDNNYFVSDSNYGWGPNGIGDLTDIGHWWNWFLGPDSGDYLAALYSEQSTSVERFSRLSTVPAGENEIVLFKSCFPNSQLGGSPYDLPTLGDNPLRGEDAWSEHMTVANAKGIYRDLLGYFVQQPDKLFVAVTAPPLSAAETDAAHAANARAFNDWLVYDWLIDYPLANVRVFDFYNVLTSNGGDAHTNDAGAEIGNHHRIYQGMLEHWHPVDQNTSAYPSDEYDSHPTRAGNRKATEEFVPLLNRYYNEFVTGRGIAPELVWIEGTVGNGAQGLCTMVLANGNYRFTCGDEPGRYAMEVIPDENGNITFFVFADGFVPYKAAFKAAASHRLDVVLAPPGASDAVGVMDLEVVHATADEGAGWILVSGTLIGDGQPLCAMVLANGSHMFSCDENLGRFDLTVPLDEYGGVTLYVFADGFMQETRWISP